MRWIGTVASSVSACVARSLNLRNAMQKRAPLLLLRAIATRWKTQRDANARAGSCCTPLAARTAIARHARDVVWLEAVSNTLEKWPARIRVLQTDIDKVNDRDSKLNPILLNIGPIGPMKYLRALHYLNFRLRGRQKNTGRREGRSLEKPGKHES